MSLAHQAAGPAPATAADATAERERHLDDPDHLDHLDEVWAHRPFAEALAETERLCAVVPLLDLFAQDPDGHLARVRAGHQRAALGLFTPNARFALPAPAAVSARRGDDGRLRLTGRFRYAVRAAACSLVAVAVQDDALRLALVPHALDGLRLHGAGRATDWGWGELTEAALPDAALSRPVTWEPDGPLAAVCDAYAWEFSRRAATWSARAVADLRRTLAAGGGSGGGGGEAFSTSQYLAHELSTLEIEISLAAAAAGFGPGLKGEPPGGQSVAAVLLACTDLLRRTVRIAEDLSTELGLPPGPYAAGDWPADAVQGCFGGRRMVEGELARRMGIPEAGAP